MIDGDGVDMSRYLATCHTEGCENVDHPVEVLAETESPVIVCGPCSQVITDVEATSS